MVWTGWRVDVGNPHAVSLLAASEADRLDQLDLGRAPLWRPADAFPAGVNLEFVRVTGDRQIAMRVFERGSGETRSCGTGTCAAAAATAAARNLAHGGADGPVTFVVDVPGGSVEVELDGDRTALTGPAVLVAHGEFVLPDGTV